MRIARILAGLVSGALLVSACKRGEGAACQADSDCRSGVTCEHARCVPCEKSDACRTIGFCGVRDGKCAASA